MGPRERRVEEGDRAGVLDAAADAAARRGGGRAGLPVEAAAQHVLALLLAGRERLLALVGGGRVLGGALAAVLAAVLLVLARVPAVCGRVRIVACPRPRGLERGARRADAALAHVRAGGGGGAAPRACAGAGGAHVALERQHAPRLRRRREARERREHRVAAFARCGRAGQRLGEALLEHGVRGVDAHRRVDGGGRGGGTQAPRHVCAVERAATVRSARVGGGSQRQRAVGGGVRRVASAEVRGAAAEERLPAHHDGVASVRRVEGHVDCRGHGQRGARA